MQRERMPGGTLFTIRRHDVDVAERIQRIRESPNALRTNAVVIAH
jgi:hypothetical protein